MAKATGRGILMMATTVVLILGWAHAGKAQAAGIDKATFDAMTRDFLALFAQDVMDQDQKRLEIDALWSYEEFRGGGAYVMGRPGALVIVVEGGLARRAEMAVEGFAIVLGHELGHILRPQVDTRFYTQIELETDYYATGTCLPKLWRNAGNAVWAQGAVDTGSLAASAMAACAAQHADPAERTACHRALKGSWAAGRYLYWFYVLRTEERDYTVPSFDGEATSAADFPQCSLEVYYAGIFGEAKPACYFVER
jgi:hypothetical protein